MYQNKCRGNSLRRIKNGGHKWKLQDIPLDYGNHDVGLPPNPTNSKSKNNSNNPEGSPALNWKFVEKLLKVILGNYLK